MTSTSTTRKRVAIYMRISTDETMQAHSLGAQEDAMREYVAARPEWEVTAVYSEQESGATVDKRPVLLQALEDAEQGKFDIFLVLRGDRLARSVEALIIVVNRLQRAGVELQAVREQWDPDQPSGRLVMNMMGALSQYERELLIDRIKMGIRQKAKKGEFLGACGPLGYRKDPATKGLVIDDDEAAVVRRIFDMAVSERLGCTRIRDALNENGVRTRTGRLWSTQRVIQTL